MSARITPGGPRDIGPAIWALSRAGGRVAGTNPPRLFTTLGRHRRLFWGWLHFAGRLMPGGRLPRRETELVILRVAHRRGCAYELTHHIRLGRRAGVTEADVRAVQDDDAAGAWSTFNRRERLLLRAADALLTDRDIDDALWAELGGVFDEPTLIEILMLVGHYDMLATTLLTLRVEPDDER